MMSLHYGKICNALISRHMKFTSSYLLSSIYNLNFNSNLCASAYANHTFKISIGESSQKRYHSDEKASKISENPAGISERSAENSQKAKDKTVQVFSKYGSDTQFDMIKTFVEEEGSLPSFEKWMELRQNVLSAKGGKLREDNVDGIILMRCINHLDKAKSFIKFLNQKYKKINAKQMSQLFKSFYVNKEKCLPEDLLFIKKMFGSFIREKKITMAVSTLDGLVSGISITDQWKQGVILLEAAGSTNEISTLIPLIEAAISHGDMEFALEYLRKILKVSTSVPDCLLEYWIRHITIRSKMDELLEFLRESNTVITKSTADLLVGQCNSHPLTEYNCTHTSIDHRSSQCHHCHQPLDPLILNPNEFEQLKSAFLDRTLVGQDVFQKTTPRELLKYLSFLDRCKPYDIVLDALNVAHLGGLHRQPETLNKVVTHYLDRGAKLLVLGRAHILRWPKAVVRVLQEKCQFFHVDNLSQDDPYVLYAAMHGGRHTKFISRDLMRSHIYLLQDRALRSTFLKWQQLNQIVILSVNGHRLTIRNPPTYVQHAHCSNRQDKNHQWHVPYREEIELTFDQVYKPKSTWLCLQSMGKTNR